MASSETPFPFLKLPLELREVIYSLYFKPADRLIHNASLQAQGFYGGLYSFEFSLCQVNKQIHDESRRVWRRENVFVKIATPWPSAGMYRVYLMADDSQNAAAFDTSGPCMYCNCISIKNHPRQLPSFDIDTQSLNPF